MDSNTEFDKITSIKRVILNFPITDYLIVLRLIAVVHPIDTFIDTGVKNDVYEVGIFSV